MQKSMALFLMLAAITNTGRAVAAEYAITMDDPSVIETVLMTPTQRDARIRAALKHHQLQAGLFVCGQRVDSPAGSTLLKAWSNEGHLLGNHTYSHPNLNSNEISLTSFQNDFASGGDIIAPYDKTTRLFRFPYLKEGDTAKKRDGMRRFLQKQDYRVGSVTIDASDWYVSERLAARVESNPEADLTPYRDYYLAHILNRANYYEDLAQRALGHTIKHTLLIHHNVLNALFLDDLIQHMEKNGWHAIDAHTAFADPIYSSTPNVLPAGESLVWSLAKAKGHFDAELRYPGEDSTYEKPAMDALNL